MRRIVSAMDCTYAELTGSGKEATAAFIAFFRMSRVSGGKEAFEKSFIVPGQFCEIFGTHVTN